MAKPFVKLEVVLGGTVYVVNREAAVALLEKLDAADAVIGELCKRLREDLRAALEVKEITPNAERPTPNDEGETEKPEGAACCAWCGEPGEQLSMSRGESEPLYVCRSAGCQREGKPATRRVFMMGYR